MVEADAGGGGREVQVVLGVVSIAVVRACGHSDGEGIFVGGAAGEALGRSDAQFGLRQIEPTAVLWSVVPFEALDQPPGFGGRKGFVEGRLAVDVEVVLDQNDGLGVGEVEIGQVFQDVSVVHGGVAVGDFDVAPAFERSKHHEEVGGAVALVLVIATGGRPGFIGIGTRVSARSCFEVSSRQTSGYSGSRGRVLTASTSSIAATNALLAS